MIHIPRWKVILILLVCVLAVVYSIPNILSADMRAKMKDHLPGWMPSQTINLGLDLQGGSHLLLQVDLSSITKERAEGMVLLARPELRQQRIGYKRLMPMDNGVRLVLTDMKDSEAAQKILRGLDSGLEIEVKENNSIEASFSESALKAIKDQTIDQSIEIVRRRVDETGTNEPVIQRQGEDRILVQLPGLDDPARIKNLLGTTAKLSFHLVDMDVSSNLQSGGGTLVLPMAENPGQTMAVDRRADVTGDMLVTAQVAQDQAGQPAVSFRFDAIGTKRFCDLSRDNVNRLFAIVLDGVIISAPVIREPICGGSGQISGNFTIKEAGDLSLLLRAGALPAPLKIIEERTVGPSLGQDSIAAGEMACLVGLIMILGFVAVYYNVFGVFANIALFINLFLVVAIMSVFQATLTMPGIAGLLLTLAMAVDSNVLIFERIREELRLGRSPVAAIDAGYNRAMATIIDSNLTTLIAAVILFSFGTGPIKGFAVTLGIGIITSFFTAIPLSRLVVATWLKHRGRKSDVPV